MSKSTSESLRRGTQALNQGLLPTGITPGKTVLPATPRYQSTPRRVRRVVVSNYCIAAPGAQPYEQQLPTRDSLTSITFLWPQLLGGTPNPLHCHFHLDSFSNPPSSISLFSPTNGATQASSGCHLSRPLRIRIRTRTRPTTSTTAPPPLNVLIFKPIQRLLGRRLCPR